MAPLARERGPCGAWPPQRRASTSPRTPQSPRPRAHPDRPLRRWHCRHHKIDRRDGRARFSERDTHTRSTRLHAQGRPIINDRPRRRAPIGGAGPQGRVFRRRLTAPACPSARFPLARAAGGSWSSSQGRATYEGLESARVILGLGGIEGYIFTEILVKNFATFDTLDAPDWNLKFKILFP